MAIVLLYVFISLAKSNYTWSQILIYYIAAER